MRRLSPTDLPHDCALPAYDRTRRGAGIVHFGPGAFMRAHQAWYTDAAMAAEPGDWMITGVSLRSRDPAEQLGPQHGLYTLAVRDNGAVAGQLIGSIAGVIVADDDPAAVTALIAAPATRIITLTITEKGYCRRADGELDVVAADTRSIYGWLARGLAARRAAGLGGVTLLSCDNLADNGRTLARLLDAWLLPQDSALAHWVRTTCTFPNSMVDRIVPATTPHVREDLAARYGVTDAAAIVTEPFSQWVIEDRFAAGRPAWDRVGANLVSDVAPYETAKLRLLNGAHSALAYLGLGSGHDYVHQAVADPALRAAVERLMRVEAAPTITPAPGQDLAAYIDALLARFGNRSIDHRLSQIASDGSQKLPQRWLATLAANRVLGRTCPVILHALGAWLRHMRGDNVGRIGPVLDPRAAEFAAAWARHGDAGIVEAVFGANGLMAGPWVPWHDEARAILDGVRSVVH